MKNPVILYVDGACRGNPGLGGWGAYIQLPDGQERELCGGETETTNNRMELTAAIEGILSIEPHLPLVIYTDSKYVKDGITQWITGWKKKNWRNVKNPDLWQKLDQLNQGRQIEWHWIKGHAGHAGNERADMLANRGADQLKAGASSLGNSADTLTTGHITAEADWLEHDPLGLDMDFSDDPDNMPMDENPEEWADEIAPKSDKQQQQKEQQLVQDTPEHGIKRTPATLRLNGKRQLILDTETTGFSFNEGDRIIEIGAIEMINRKLTGSSFHVYLNPQRPVGDSVNVHGLNDAFLQDKLLFTQIAHELNEYLQGAEIIAHNATFDMNFLEGEFLKAGLPSLKQRVEVVDTLALAKRKHPGQKNSLDALVRRYDIPPRDRTFHGALLDAEILADVYLAMTGGQVTLDIGDEQDHADGTTLHRRFEQRFNLPVIAASLHEAAAHDQWLSQFADKNGQPALWASIFNSSDLA
ncbi:DNA polymerase III subunit epsilon [Alkanindiges sp. WGS2144]|uniref:DNA polymerase III subunit epsilon n=1 Tax=Alkanindiges sp. WGS2144 TaxID=3366808 RepID=UPI003753ABF5